MRLIVLAGYGLASVMLCISAHAAPPTRAQTPAVVEMSAPAVATDATDATSQVIDLDTVVVSGAQPGPGMWKVSKGEHVLWILGTLSPLPKNVQWLSGDVEKTIAQSQEIIASPGIEVNSGIGMFRTLLLVPSMFKARKNPGGKTLQDVVPADLYARWSVLKARYIGGDRGIEHWRPIFAAQELYEKAMRKSGLAQGSIVQPIVKKAARQHKIPVTSVTVALVVKDPKSALKKFNHSALNDTGCFAGTMTRIETDLEGMRARANAWAIGDIQALRALPYRNQYALCMAAVTETGLARELGVTDLSARVAQKWLGAAEAALAKNQVTFATLPISELLKPDGYVEKLRVKGYEVEAP